MRSVLCVDRVQHLLQVRADSRSNCRVAPTKIKLRQKKTRVHVSGRRTFLTLLLSTFLLFYTRRAGRVVDRSNFTGGRSQVTTFEIHILLRSQTRRSVNLRAGATREPRRSDRQDKECSNRKRTHARLRALARTIY